MLLALASIQKWIIHQIDIKTAFLEDDLDEEVYMHQPEGFMVEGQKHKVCKLVKSLYGLKQASKQWRKGFHQVILTCGFKMHESDNVYTVSMKMAKGS